MVGEQISTILLMAGFVMVLIVFVGGIRGLFQPKVKPFFLRRSTDRLEDEAAPEHHRRRKPHDRRAA